MAKERPNRRHRSQILLDDDVYRELAAEAEIEGRSISSLVREAISQWLAPRRSRKIMESPFWPIVGTGHGGNPGNLPVSEKVDAYTYGSVPSPEPSDAAAGGEIIIAKAGKPIAMLTPLKIDRSQRQLGSMRGKIWIAADFDEPLPPALLACFHGEP